MSFQQSSMPNTYHLPLHTPEFQAPAHNLDDRQREQVVAIAEAGHNDDAAPLATTVIRPVSDNVNGSNGASHHSEIDRADSAPEAAVPSGRGHRADDIVATPAQHDINSVPGVGDAAPKQGKANSGGTNHGSFPNVIHTTSSRSSETSVGSEMTNYPPQLHAGSVGLGPNYHATGHMTFTDKLKSKVPGLHGPKEAENPDAATAHRYAVARE